MRAAATAACLSAWLLAGACGWSGEEQEVVDAWMDGSSALAEGAWDDAWTLLSPGTRTYLDSAAAELTRMGALEIPSGRDLLAMTFDEYFDLSGAVTLVLAHGDSMRLEVEGPPGPVTRWMVPADGRWVIDLETPYREALSSAFEGAFLEPSLIVPAPAAQGGGKD